MATKHAVGSLIGFSGYGKPHIPPMAAAVRSFNSLRPLREDLHSQPSSESAPPPPPEPYHNPRLDPRTVAGRKQEKALWKKLHRYPIGPRRRRVALQHTSNVPFEQLPYQCFQEARKVLGEDREEKAQQIEKMRARIVSLGEKDAVECGGEARKQQRLKSMRAELEELKIHADINDPIVKKNFEDGRANMNKPIYRFLANREWRSYRRKVVMQRITQMGVVPDVLPKIDPIVDVRLAFGRKNIQPGEKVPSSWSEQPPALRIQPFDKGDRLVTIVAIDSDVPDLEEDRFTYRCHGIFSNVNISPTRTKVDLKKLPASEHVVMDWQPPTSQKGAPYHKLSIWVLQHPEGKTVDVPVAREKFKERENFIFRSFLDKMRIGWGNEAFKPVGITMFRTEWDENMDGLMERLGQVGVDVELKRMKVEPLPYRKKNSERYR